MLKYEFRRRHIQVKELHPAPSQIHKEQFMKERLTTMILNVRDPVDRFVSAFRWATKVLCHPDHVKRYYRRWRRCSG